MNELSTKDTQEELYKTCHSLGFGNELADRLTNICHKLGFSTYNIADHSAYSGAGDLIKRISKELKTLDGFRKDVTRPLDEKKKYVMDLFRPATDTLKRADGIIRRSMQGFATEEKRKAAEEERKQKVKEAKERAELEAKVQERAKSGDLAGAVEMQKEVEVVPPPAPVTQVIPTSQSTTTKKTYGWELIDFEAVPDEYKELNKTKLNEMARLSKGEAAVPGVKFITKEIVALK